MGRCYAAMGRSTRGLKHFPLGSLTMNTDKGLPFILKKKRPKSAFEHRYWLCMAQTGLVCYDFTPFCAGDKCTAAGCDSATGKWFLTLLMSGKLRSLRSRFARLSTHTICTGFLYTSARYEIESKEWKEGVKAHIAKGRPKGLQTTAWKHFPSC